MITNVKLYEVQHADDYYELDEHGEQLPISWGNLVYTDGCHYLVEWHDEVHGVITQERVFDDLNEALEFYKEMKAKESKP